MDGVRDSKTVDGVKHEYITQGGNVTLERWNDGEEKSLEFIYDNGGAPYSVIYSRGNEVDTYYYILNQQGDVIRIVDTSGKTVSEYTYNGWGEILNVSNAKDSEIGTLNPIRYRGYYYDFELNMYYLQSRYYDPVMKRMIASDDESLTADATLNNNNLFAYCDNNPVNRADTEGEIWNVIAGAVLGASFNVATQMLANGISGDKLSSGLVSAAISGAIGGAVTALPGMGTVGEIVVNSVTSGVVEATSQVRANKEKKKRGQKESSRSEIACSVATAALSSAASSLVPPRTRGSAKNVVKSAKHVGRSCKSAVKAIRTLCVRGKKQGAKRVASGIKTCAKAVKKSAKRNRSVWSSTAKGNLVSMGKTMYCNMSVWIMRRYEKWLKKHHRRA